MKEFDFDELDKAVNSLMGDVSQPDEPAVAGNPVSTPPVSSTPTPLASPSIEQVPPAPTASVQEAITSPPIVSPASRRGGRFMDVVHPSSDMKTARTSIPSREGITITPPAFSGITSSSPVEVSPSPEVSIPAEKTEVVEVPPVNEWPDPIAMHEEAQTSQTEDITPEEQVVESSANDELSQVSAEPLSSPFLSDAKVEKRPLGGAQILDQAIANELSKVSDEADTTSPAYAADTPVTPNEDIISEEIENTKELDSQLPLQSDEKAPLPAELASDLVAIEAGSTTVNEEPAAQPVVAASLNNDQKPPVGAGSIPQQYTEQPSTGDDSHAAIYDNEVSQRALLHPTKKKSGWLVVLWVVLILIVGIGSGAALWFLGII